MGRLIDIHYLIHTEWYGVEQKPQSKTRWHGFFCSSGITHNKKHIYETS